MDILVFFLVFPLVGALLGWFTNYIAVKMLFHPRQPKTLLRFKIGKWEIPGITFQGIFPKRQQAIAVKIGKVVADELLSINDIKERVVTDSSMDKMLRQVEGKMNYFMEEKIPKKFPILSKLTSKRMKYDLRDQMLAEVKLQLPDIMDKYLSHFEEELDIEGIITEKFSQLSSGRLEQVMNDILEKEFKFIEILGGVIGFLVGLAQAGVAVLV